MQQKQLFCIFLFNDLVNIYTLIIAFILLLLGQNYYFFTYFSLLSIKKIYTLFAFDCGDEGCIFQVYNFFQMGFFYIYLDDGNTVIQEQFLNLKFSWLLIQILLQYLFFFYEGILENTRILPFVAIASYLNFILFILLLITVVSTYQINQQGYTHDTSKIIQIFLRQFVITLSYYLTICSLTFYEDGFGLNLGNYQNALIILSFLISQVLYYFNQRILDFDEITQLLIYSILFNMDFSFKQYGFKDLEISVVSTINYFYEIFRIIMLLVFSYHSLDQSSSVNQSINTEIRQIFFISSVFFSIIYLLINFKGLNHNLIKQRYYKVRCYKDLEKVTSQLRQKSNLIQIFSIFLEADQLDDNIQPILYDESKLNILFWQSVSYQLKLKNIVNISQILNSQQFMSDQNILIEVEHIHNEAFKQLEIEISNKYIDQLILQRVENGFVDNWFTKKLLKRNNIKHRNKILKYISFILSINVYYKHIYMFMMYNPREVLYDLGDF